MHAKAARYMHTYVSLGAKYSTWMENKYSSLSLSLHKHTHTHTHSFSLESVVVFLFVKLLLDHLEPIHLTAKSRMARACLVGPLPSCQVEEMTDLLAPPQLRSAALLVLHYAAHSRSVLSHGNATATGDSCRRYGGVDSPLVRPRCLTAVLLKLE